MKKILTITLLVLALVLIVAFGGFKSPEKTANQTNQFEPVDLTEINPHNLISVVSTVTLPKPQLTLPSLASLESGLAGRAWEVFQSYLASAKAHDLEGLRKVSYQISSTCNDPAQEESCFSRMDMVYDLGAQFKQEEMVNIWSDSKQIIMASAYATVDDTTFGSRGMARAIIYFTRDELGNPKVLSFNGLDGSFVLKKDLSDGELDKHLSESIQDDDEDGLPNKVEICEDQSSSTGNCTDTDPNKRDTDGDGWWDGIQQFFY